VSQFGLLTVLDAATRVATSLILLVVHEAALHVVNATT